MAERAKPGVTGYGVPLRMPAHKAAGNDRGMNMVALGALAAIIGVDKDRVTHSIKTRYGKKKQGIIDANVNSFVEGYEWAKGNIKKEIPIPLKGRR